MKDVYISLRLSLKLEKVTDKHLMNGDIDKDNKINTKDTLWTLRKVLHII